MIQKQKKGIKWYCFHQLSGYRNIGHLVTTRYGGVSKGDYAAMNLSYKTNEDKSTVRSNRITLSELIGIPPADMLFPGQVHGETVRIIKDYSQVQDKAMLNETDAIVTNLQGIAIFVLAADCVPLLMYDPVKRVIASAHAGWRGTVQQIAKHTIHAMRNHFGTRLEDVMVGIGPSIGPDAYNVGADVIHSINKVFPQHAGMLVQEKADNYYVNLWKANKLVLEQAGVATENIEISGLCTYKNNATFYSHRFSGGKTGRFASGIYMKKDSC